VLKRCSLAIFPYSLLALLIGQLFVWPATANDSNVLQRIQQRGFLICGTGHKEPGFAIQTEFGWRGIYIDLCRALAAATLQDGTSLRFRPLPSSERFTAVSRGEVDVLSRGTALAFSSDTSNRTIFVAPFFYEGTGFLIRKSSKITSALELSGAQICVITGSLARASVDRFFQARDMNIVAVGSDTWSGVVSQFIAGGCAVLAADFARLAIERSQLDKADEYTVLPEMASTEMFGPITSSDDWNWFKIVRWVVYALIKAEELGISRENVQTIAERGSIPQKNFLQTSTFSADTLGLRPTWLTRMLADVGNYGEIYERNLGKVSGLNVPRRLNALVKDGGLMLAPAFR